MNENIMKKQLLIISLFAASFSFAQETEELPVYKAYKRPTFTPTPIPVYVKDQEKPKEMPVYKAYKRPTFRPEVEEESTAKDVNAAIIEIDSKDTNLNPEFTEIDAFTRQLIIASINCDKQFGKKFQTCMKQELKEAGYSESDMSRIDKFCSRSQALM